MQWLKLSGNLYSFGEQSINRIEPNEHNYLTNGQKTPWITKLFNNKTEIAQVKESIEQIEGMLKNGQ